MVRSVSADLTRVYVPDKAKGARDLYFSTKRKRSLWRTSPHRRTAAEADGSLDVTSVPICGRCTATSKTKGRRCARRSCLDYRYCMQHLQSDTKLAIAPSRRLRDIGVPKKALGLYAAHPGQRLIKDSEGYPVHAPHVVVFRKGEVVTSYGGEILTRQQFDIRYDDPTDMDTAAYAIATRSGVVDGLAAASAASYSNDPIDIPKIMAQARNETDFKRLYQAASDSRHVNVRARERNKAIELVATKNIEHGAEILWNYGWGFWACESMKRGITGTGW